jgi:hypothetical protein
MQRSRKAFFISTSFAVALIAAMLLAYGGFQRDTTTHASPVPDLLSALPDGAPSLVYIDLAAVRASPFYQHRPDKGPIAIPNQDYADFMRATGFDFEKDLERVVIASWPAVSAKEPAKVVAIAEGHFDRAKIRDYALRNGKLDQQQGHEVFLFPTTGNPMSMSTMTFLDDRRIALINGKSIAPLFSSHADASAGDTARDRAGRLDGAAAYVISRVPPIPDNAGGAGMQNPGSAQFLALARSVQWITLAVRPEGENLRVSLEGECDNNTDALQLKSMLELLRVFGKAGLDSAKSKQTTDQATLAMAQTLLTNAEVTQAAERVRILMEITPDVWHLSGPKKPQL